MRIVMKFELPSGSAREVGENIGFVPCGGFVHPGGGIFFAFAQATTIFRRETQP